MGIVSTIKSLFKKKEEPKPSPTPQPIMQIAPKPSSPLTPKQFIPGTSTIAPSPPKGNTISNPPRGSSGSGGGSSNTNTVTLQDLNKPNQGMFIPGTSILTPTNNKGNTFTSQVNKIGTLPSKGNQINGINYPNQIPIDNFWYQNKASNPLYKEAPNQPNQVNQSPLTPSPRYIPGTSVIAPTNNDIMSRPKGNIQEYPGPRLIKVGTSSIKVIQYGTEKGRGSVGDISSLGIGLFSPIGASSYASTSSTLTPEQYRQKLKSRDVFLYNAYNIAQGKRLDFSNPKINLLPQLEAFKINEEIRKEAISNQARKKEQVNYLNILGNQLEDYNRMSTERPNPFETNKQVMKGLGLTTKEISTTILPPQAQVYDIQKGNKPFISTRQSVEPKTFFTSPELESTIAPLNIKTYQSLKQNGKRTPQSYLYASGNVLEKAGETASIGALTFGTGLGSAIGTGLKSLPFVGSKAGGYILGAGLIGSDIGFKGYEYGKANKRLGGTFTEGALYGGAIGVGESAGFLAGAYGGSKYYQSNINRNIELGKFTTGKVEPIEGGIIRNEQTGKATTVIKQEGIFETKVPGTDINIKQNVKTNSIYGRLGNVELQNNKGTTAFDIFTEVQGVNKKPIKISSTGQSIEAGNKGRLKIRSVVEGQNKYTQEEFLFKNKLLEKKNIPDVLGQGTGRLETSKNLFGIAKTTSTNIKGSVPSEIFTSSDYERLITGKGSKAILPEGYELGKNKIKISNYGITKSDIYYAEPKPITSEFEGLTVKSNIGTTQKFSGQARTEMMSSEAVNKRLEDIRSFKITKAKPNSEFKYSSSSSNQPIENQIQIYQEPKIKTTGKVKGSNININTIARLQSENLAKTYLADEYSFSKINAKGLKTSGIFGLASKQGNNQAYSLGLKTDLTQRNSLKQNQILNPNIRTRQSNNQLYTPIQNQRQSNKQDQLFSYDYNQRQIQDQTYGKSFPNFDYIPINLPPSNPPFIIPPFGFGFGSEENYKSIKGNKRKKGYVPSFSALVFNIKGRYKKGRFSRSGLDFRPILITSRRKTK